MDYSGVEIISKFTDLCFFLTENRMIFFRAGWNYPHCQGKGPCRMTISCMEKDPVMRIMLKSDMAAGIS